MPLYEFECPRCGVFAEILPFSRAGKPRRHFICDTMAKPIISVPAPPVMGGMIYQPIPGDPRPKAEHKVPYKDWKRADDAHKQRMLKNAGKGNGERKRMD